MLTTLIWIHSRFSKKAKMNNLDTELGGYHQLEMLITVLVAILLTLIFDVCYFHCLK